MTGIQIRGGMVCLVNDTLLDHVRAMRHLYAYDWNERRPVMIPCFLRRILGRRWRFDGREADYQRLMEDRRERT